MGLWTKLKEANEKAKNMAYLRDHLLDGEWYSCAGSRKVPVAGATAFFDAGVQQSRMTGTRVITGGVLFGPAGAVVGGLLKKKKHHCYVTVTFADGNVAIAEVPIKEQSQAREFAAKVNAAGARYALPQVH